MKKITALALIAITLVACKKETKPLQELTQKLEKLKP